MPESAVCDSLIAEHRALEGHLSALKNLLANANANAVDWEAVRAAMDQIDRELKIHLACEEHALFPMVWVYRSMVLMEVEHDQLLEAWRRAQSRIGIESDLSGVEALPRFQEVLQSFDALLQAHVLEEDRGVFPWCETVLNPYEKSRVEARMADIRKRAQTGDPPELVREEPWFQCIDLPVDTTDRPVSVQLVAEAPQLQIKQYTLRAGHSLAKHWSPQQVTLFCVSGRAMFKTESQTVALQPGQSLLLSPRLLFAIEAVEDTRLLLVMQTLLPDRMAI